MNIRGGGASPPHTLEAVVGPPRRIKPRHCVGSSRLHPHGGAASHWAQGRRTRGGLEEDTAPQRAGRGEGAAHHHLSKAVVGQPRRAKLRHCASSNQLQPHGDLASDWAQERRKRACLKWIRHRSARYGARQRLPPHGGGRCGPATTRQAVPLHRHQLTEYPRWSGVSFDAGYAHMGRA